MVDVPEADNRSQPDAERISAADCSTGRRGNDSHQLRHVIFGGEALDVATLKPWYERTAVSVRS